MLFSIILDFTEIDPVSIYFINIEDFSNQKSEAK